MSSAATARLSVGLASALTVLVTSIFFFQSLRSPGTASVGKIDLWIAFFSASVLVSWLGIGRWMGFAVFIVATTFLGLAAFMGLTPFWILFLTLASVAFLAHRVHSEVQVLLSQHSAVAEGWEERLNDLQAEKGLHQSQNHALERKIARYETLEEFISQLSTNLSLQETMDRTLAQANQMTPPPVSAGQQTCLLYLVDREQHELSLQSSYRTEGETIKHKKGDIMDYWILKQRQPLIVEDIRKDFRFNVEDQNPEFRRSFRSLIAVPLMDEKGVLGVLRIDSPNPNQYTPEDLRVLAIIADLATTAIRNATLFAMIQELAIRDGLTELYVHRYLLQRLQEEILRTFRSNGSLSLVLMDIDWFKKYNDQFGHISGDLVLKQLGKRLQDLTEPGEIAARYGGEEFALVLPGTNVKSAFLKAEKIRQSIESEIFWLRQQPTRVTLSLGVAAFPAQAKDREELIRLADQALYKAKSGGRNQTCSLSLS